MSDNPTDPEESARLQLREILRAWREYEQERAEAVEHLEELGVDPARIGPYLWGEIPSLPEDPEGRIRSDLPRKARDLPDRTKVPALRRVGGTPAAAYFRGKDAAKQRAGELDLAGAAKSEDCMAVLNQLRELERELDDDVAQGRSDDGASGRASTATDLFERFLGLAPKAAGAP